MPRAVRELATRLLDEDVELLVVVQLEHLRCDADADSVGFAFVQVDDHAEVTHGESRTRSCCARKAGSGGF